MFGGVSVFFLLKNVTPHFVTLKGHLALLLQVYDIQGNLQDGSQVVVSVIFENKSNSFLKSMEFNVLDSLNSKLQRPDGAGPHDGLVVPFQLPPGMTRDKI